MAFRRRSDVALWRHVLCNRAIHLASRSFWFVGLGVLVLSLQFFDATMAYAAPATPQVILQGSPSTPNTMNPTTGTTSQPSASPTALPSSTKPSVPQIIAHPMQMPMQAGSVELHAGQAADFLGSDGRLELRVPADALTTQDITQAGSHISLKVTQVAPASGANAGGSGEYSLGTYLLQLVDAKGHLLSHGLRKPLTALYHFQNGETSLYTGNASLLLNGSMPAGATNMPGVVQPAARTNLASTMGKPHVEQATLDASVNALSASPLVSTPTSTLGWDSDSPIAAFGKPDPSSVNLSAGALTYSLPITMPNGPGGLTPPITLSYSSESVNEQHNASAAAGWVGEGWNLSLGAITWSEQNVTAGCLSCGGATWQNSWQFSDAFGTSSALIPPDEHVSTYTDDTPNKYCAKGGSPSSPCPILWHTASESYDKIYAYVGSVQLPGQSFNPPCFRAWLPNGVMEEFGCTPDSLQYYYEAGVGALVTGWNLDLITDPQGNQIHLSYQRDMVPWTDPTTHQTKMFPRDVELSSISYDSPNCHNAQTMCTGSQWQPLMQVVFNAAHTVSQLTGAKPSGCNTGDNMRCDDPVDLSSKGGMAASLVQNTFVLNSVQVQVRTSGGMPWNMLNTYSLSYEQSGPGNITDPVSGMQRSTAGMLDLTRIQESGVLSGSALLYSGRKIGTDRAYAYLKVFDLSQQHLTVGPHTTLSYWIYPQSQAQNSGVDGENSTCAALDLVFSDGTTLHDSNAVDQHGHGMNPAEQCGQLKLDQWNLVTTDIGAVARGKTISRIDVGYDPPVFTGGYRGYIDDVSLSNPGGSNNKPLFATSFEPGQPQPTWTNAVVSQSDNITGFCCGLNGPEAGVRQENYHTGSNTSGASLPPVNFTYTSQTNTYVDSFYRATPTTNCGPSWNTRCLLWNEGVAGDSRFISAINNGQGMEQHFTWSIAHNNTHGAPGGGDNNANPFACDANQSGYPCDEADDSGWSHAVLTRQENTTIRLTQHGQGGAQTSTPVTATTDYHYRLTYPLLAQECSDCVAGMYWGNQNDTNFLGYYDATFMGFAQATVDQPSGAVQVHDFEAGEGWGVYDTKQTPCFVHIPCHNDPWWDVANAAHGSEIEMQQYDTDGKTLLQQVNTSYAAICPPEGVSPTPPFEGLTFDGRLVNTTDINNPIAVCAIQQTQQTTKTFDGSSNAVSKTTSWTYDHYGRVTQQKTTGNGGTPNTVVQNTSYVWNDGVTATKNSASGTYILDTQASTNTEDGSGNRLACSERSYDGQVFATGQSSKLTGALQTSQTNYAQCGTSANHYAQDGASTTTTTYDQYGNPITTDDADANAGISGHTGCTVSGSRTRYTTCTTYDSTFETLQTASTNALNQTGSTGYANTSALFGFGIRPTSTTDIDGQITSYTYDALGRMTSETAPQETSGEHTKEWAYTYWCSDTSAGSPCVEIDEIDRLDANTTTTSRYFYDGEGRLVETRAPGINGKDVVTYAYYDTSGRQIFKSNAYFVTAYTGKPGAAAYSIPDSTQPGTSTSYPNMRQTKVTDPNSHTSITTRSVICGISGTSDTGCYEQSAVVDANAHQTATLTGVLGKTGYTQTYLGTSSSGFTRYATTANTYDAAGDLLSTVSPDGAITTSVYDNQGRVIRQTDPDTGTTINTYDPNGNQIKSVDARGGAGTVYTGYDGLNRPLWHSSENSANGAWVTFSYDSTAQGNQGVGELTGEHFAGSGGLSGSYTYIYDARGQQISETVTVNGSSYSTQASYNDNGKITSEIYPTGEVVTPAYSSTGWMDGLSTTTNGETTALASDIAYDGQAGAAGKITSMTLGNGVYTEKLGYDLGLRPTSESLTDTSNNETMYTTQSAYDAANNVVNVQSSFKGQTDIQQFCYDELNRLTWSGTRGTPPCSGVSVRSGTLAAAGYQQSESYNIEGQFINGPAGTYTYGNRSHPHAVTSTSSGFSAAYDAAGNQTCRALSDTTSCTTSSLSGQILTYDAQGRLSAWQNKAQSPTENEDVLYDGSGNRVATMSTDSNGAATLTVYLGDIEEVQVGANGTQTTTYYAVANQRIAARVNGKLYYFGNDTLGSQVAVFDTSGNLIGSRLYGPYGSNRYSTGTLPTSIGFTGQYADNMTGLDYYVARYYDPVTGQFLTPDSVQGNAQGMDPYTYVGNNPETRNDPTGHWGWGAILAVAAVVVVVAVVAVVAAPVVVAAAGAAEVGAAAAATADVAAVGAEAAAAGGEAAAVGTEAAAAGGEAAAATTEAAATGTEATAASTEATTASTEAATANTEAASTSTESAATSTEPAPASTESAPVSTESAPASAEPTAPEPAPASAEPAPASAEPPANVSPEATPNTSEEAVNDASSGCSSAGLSFAANTPVKTAQGEQAIGSIQVGQQVWAYNPQTKKMELQPVQHTWINHDNDLVDLTITTTTQEQHDKATKKTSEVIHTNKKHPFLIVEKGFLPVGQIKIGMHVVEADGQEGVITGWKSVPGVQAMYNLTVAQDHTFVVGMGQWVVHNCGGEEIHSNPDAQTAFQNAMQKLGRPLSNDAVRSQAKFGDAAGLDNGMREGYEFGWRVDWDPEKGAHFNWFDWTQGDRSSGLGRWGAETFPGSEEDVTDMILRFTVEGGLFGE